MKKDKSIRYLTGSIVGVCILITGLFILLGISLNQKSLDSIEQVGRIYMTGMNEEITMHYETIIGMQLSMLDALMETIPPDSVDHEVLYDELIYNAIARDFECLAVYGADGSMEMLFGENVMLNDPEPFKKSLNQGEQKVAAGYDALGNRLVLLGVPCGYHMKNGEVGVALVAGLSVDYVSHILFLDEEDSLVDSYIIRRDGSYVIRSESLGQKNYFDQIYSIFHEQNEKDAEQYIQELKTAMENKEDYSVILDGDVASRHLCCTKLPYSEWYLVTILPFDSIRDVFADMSQRWSFMVFGVCLVALAAMLFVFLQYVYMAKKKMLALEEARRDAEHANRAKSEFLSNMSHDIRTPMNAIVGMTAIAIANVDNQEQVQNCLRKIALSGRHLLGLINDVLDMAKIESGKMTLNREQVSLREVMDNMVNIVQSQVRAKRQQFNIFIHDISTENVCCDSVRLNQVLLNILGNAVKFTPEEGSICVSLFEENSPKGDGYIRTHFVVKDTGIGMSEEYKKTIFESFSREDSARVQKTEGSGLGMAITKYIVDAMGGTIEVESEEGKGSEFHVTLDLEKALVQEADMVLPKWNMLVVDDDEQLCESAVASLRSIGVYPDWCLDAETAIKMIEERHKRQEDYHIILLDWKLPEMNGITAAREIRRRYGEDIPILLISAYDWGEIENDAKQAGVTGFISKPLFKSTLFYALQPFAGEQDLDDLESAPEENEIDLKGRHILLAEDNELNWEIAEELLSEEGLELEWAENGRICLDKFRNSPEGYYDAILMDLRMPEMNGYETTQAIRDLERADASLPIIAMSADAFAEDVRKCLNGGMNAHIAKPIDVREALRLLEKYIKKK